MQHRHLNHQEYTLAAIDDVISRGKINDWLDLRNAVAQSPQLLDKIERICTAKASDPYA
ncbi:MAG: hypothetical protein IBX50_15110 [Marinospirillum sp.]|uniref:hypothetical protein n=1 Tax=Marinospirillum sp. TaxID=2183934 RepID=UPI001A06D7EE|nr:hypothetical protein [Marinospirillum sp.]MBE0508018.1 hypothetical protein [Marinospirillum sp.]